MRPRFKSSITFALLLCAQASTALAQLVTNPDYGRHTPTAVVYKVAPEDQRIFLFAVSPNGIAQKGWNLTTNPQAWSSWIYDGNQTGVSPREWQRNNDYYSLPFVTWTGGDGIRRVNGFFSYSSLYSNRVGMPFWHGAYYDWSVKIPPASAVIGGEYFLPTTGFSWNDGNSDRLNIFGYATTPQAAKVTGAGFNSLIELWWNGHTWDWTEHGEPFGEAKWLMGPNSSLWDSNGRKGYVFLAATWRVELFDGMGSWFNADPVIRYRFYDDQQCPGWCWRTLGNQGLGVGNHVREMKAPLALSRVENNTYKINLFVVAWVDRQLPGQPVTSGWELLERFWDGTNWSSWNSSGLIPNAGTRNDGVEMTSGVSWRLGNTLRANLFGYSVADGKLREYYYNGTTWQWGLNLAPPSGRYFRTSSSAAIDLASQDRVSVFGRDDAGTVWELYWDTARAPLQWRWQQH